EVGDEVGRGRYGRQGSGRERERGGGRLARVVHEHATAALREVIHRGGVGGVEPYASARVGRSYRRAVGVRGPPVYEIVPVELHAVGHMHALGVVKMVLFFGEDAVLTRGRLVRRSRLAFAQYRILRGGRAVLKEREAHLREVRDDELPLLWYRLFYVERVDDALGRRGGERELGHGRERRRRRGEVRLEARYARGSAHADKEHGGGHFAGEGKRLPVELVRSSHAHIVRRFFRARVEALNRATRSGAFSCARASRAARDRRPLP